jgi:hypothetical protein
MPLRREAVIVIIMVMVHIRSYMVHVEDGDGERRVVAVTVG